MWSGPGKRDIISNNNTCSMKYSTSEAVHLWLCLGCGFDTSLPAKKRPHSPHQTSGCLPTRDHPDPTRKQRTVEYAVSIHPSDQPQLPVTVHLRQEQEQGQGYRSHAMPRLNYLVMHVGLATNTCGRTRSMLIEQLPGLHNPLIS